MEVSQLIRQARLAIGATENDLARLASTTPSAIVAYEAGNRMPNITTLERLLDACKHDLTLAAVPRAGRPGERPCDRAQRTDADAEHEAVTDTTTTQLEEALAGPTGRSAASRSTAPRSTRSAPPSALAGLEFAPDAAAVRAAIEIEMYEPRHEAQVVELLQRALDKWPEGLGHADAGEFFRWKMYGRPGSDSRSSLVALYSGQVVGFVAQLSWPLRLDGATITSLRSVDLAIDPAHRLQGVSFELKQAALEIAPGDTAVGWSAKSERHRPGRAESDQREIVVLPCYVDVRGDPGKPHRRSMLNRASKAEIPIEAETAAALLSDGDFVSSALSDAAPADDRLENDHDLAYLRWRYGRFGEYHAIRGDNGANPPAVAIFEVTRRESLRVAEVCELLVASGDFAAKRRLLRQISGLPAVDLVRARFASDLEAARFGFVRERDGWLLTVRQTAELPVDPMQSESWGLSIGDLQLP